MRQNWPERLWLVRHGQSQGNVARDAADEAGAHEIDIDMRDVDVPLVRRSATSRPRPPGAGSPRLPRDERPEIILSSPYVRAADRRDHLQAGRACRAARRGPSSTSACASASSGSSTG